MSENRFLSLGIMSGTSLDGLDLALCEFTRNNENWKYTILKATTIPYSLDWKNKLIVVEEESAPVYVQTDWKLGNYIGEQVQSFLKDVNETPDCIASHGHTIFHQPDGKNGFTAQIGNGAAIAAKTGLTVINDFRIADIALGGQGAPLVPIGDKLLFANYDFCLNLGGIANISAEIHGERKAYDICAFNMALNHIAAMKGKEYDEGGKLAAAGKLQSALLDELEQLPFFNKTGPKSLGKEWFLAEMLPLIQKYDYSPEDLAHTFVRHITSQIAKTCHNMRPDFKAEVKMLVTGGGAYNTYFIKCLKEAVPWLQIDIPDPQLLEFKEALVFAFLGVLRILNIPNCLASVTGANSDSISGVMHKSPITKQLINS